MRGGGMERCPGRKGSTQAPGSVQQRQNPAPKSQQHHTRWRRRHALRAAEFITAHQSSKSDSRHRTGEHRRNPEPARIAFCQDLRSRNPVAFPLCATRRVPTPTAASPPPRPDRFPDSCPVAWTSRHPGRQLRERRFLVATLRSCREALSRLFEMSPATARHQFGLMLLRFRLPFRGFSSAQHRCILTRYALCFGNRRASRGELCRGCLRHRRRSRRLAHDTTAFEPIQV